MAKTLNTYLRGKKAEGFSSRPRYVADGDYLAYYLEDTDFYAERIDELLTIYRSMKTKKLVGCKVKGVRRILKTLGSFAIAICDEEGRVLLGPLLFGSMALARNPSVLSDHMRRRRYDEVRRAAKDVRLDKGELQPV